MSKTKKRTQLAWTILLGGAATLLAAPAFGQGLGNSPYSRVGLGDYTGNVGGVRQLGMGGVGLAAPNTGNVNELNPALLVYLPRTTYEAAFDAQVKTVRNADASHRTGTGTLGYLALALPLSTRWGAAVGLKPFSTVDYGSATTDLVPNDPNGGIAFKRLKGAGGLSEAYFAHGVHVLRDLNLGVSASYLFGTVEQSSGTAVSTPTFTQQLVVDEETLRYSDFLFRVAGQYRHKLGKDLNVNLAAVHTFGTSVRTTRQRNQQRLDGNGAVVGTPTLLGEDAGYTALPARTQLGLTFDNGRNWTASLDGAVQQWSKFQPFSQLTEANLSDTWRVAAGGELTPDPTSIEHYRQRVTYRVGLSLAQLPYAPAGQRLYDRAVHWGFAFPLPTSSALESTTISLAFIYGLRGNTSYLPDNSGASNVQESYVRMQVGATLSNRWFIKRRLQ